MEVSSARVTGARSRAYFLRLDRIRPLLPFAWALLALAAPPAASGKTLNGFDLSPAAIPVREIQRGGPPRDGIPALVRPRVEASDLTSWPANTRVVGVEMAGESRAYPVAILDWHELVNDRLGSEPILVSYCPLCGTALVFEGRVDGDSRTFGVSGLLYKSDVLMYDRETESLWSQIQARAVTGPALGQPLRLLRSTLTTWGEWRREHPESTILSPQTGYARDYGRTPYDGYADSARLYFPVKLDGRYHPKTPTVGLRLASGEARGYPAQEVVKAGGRLEDEFQGRAIVVEYRRETRSFRVEAPPDVEVIEGYWFAWAAFHPDTEVWTSDTEAKKSRFSAFSRRERPNWR